MSKEKNSSNKKSSKSTERRFGNRRENYVDSFRWDFVEGDAKEDVGPDDELFDASFYGESNEEDFNAASAVKKGGRKKQGRHSGPKGSQEDTKDARKDQPESRSTKQSQSKSKENDNRTKSSAEDKSGKPERNTGGKKKGAIGAKQNAKKPTPFFDLFNDDDDDLNLPSYGRTPVPTDEELPKQVVKHAEKQGEKQGVKRDTKSDVKPVKEPVRTPQNQDSRAPQTSRRISDDNRNRNESEKKKPKEFSRSPKAPTALQTEVEAKRQPTPQSTSRSVPQSAESNFATETSSKEHHESVRPRREQMVWDPDKKEYVPLVIPPKREPKAGKRERKKSDSLEPKNAEPQVTEARNTETAVSKEYVSEERVSEARKSEPKRSAPPSRGSVEKSTERPTEKPTEKPLEKKTEKKLGKKAGKRTERTEKDKTERDIEKPIAKTETKDRNEGRREDRSRDRRRKDASGPGTAPSTASSSARYEKTERPQRGDVPPLIESSVPDPSDVEAEDKGFAKLGVSETMLEALKIVRYLEPTPIQSGVFQQVKAGRDVMGQAQTGTGKTAAFSIPIIEGIEDCPPGNDPVALILVPTRELAVQVRDEAIRLAYGRDVRISACYGGKPIAKQIARLREGVDVIVGTPGRILDLMNRRALSLDALRWVVLDEADRMLDIGFRPDIEKILKRTPKERQTLLFSATLPAPVVRLAEKYMQSPEVLDFSNKGVAVDTIEQYYVTVDPERKFDALVYLLNEQQPNQAIIFTRTKRGADRLARLLSKRFDSLAAIHGDLSQTDRDRVMAKFRAGNLRYLVATDVVGRGIDVSGISHIINFDIPAFCDDYVHRVGRTGRMGREGIAFTFVTVQEGSELTRIEMRIDKLLKRADLKGFESFTKPSDPSASPDDDLKASETPKPVYGKPVRKIRRAL